MKIVHDLPPNYKKIQEHFPGADFDEGVVFTYGDTCYCKRPLTPDLYVHEQVHTRQQKKPKKWWKKYFKSPKFRLEQETEAYQAQWEWVKHNVRDRNVIHKVRDSIALTLSGKLYGNIISYNEALQLLRE